MRKYIIGGIVGLALGISANAYADDLQSLVGMKVEGQTAIYMDGEPLDTAIIVDGTSYAPARKMAEASGNDVEFKEDGIYLESKEPVELTIPQQIAKIDLDIQFANNEIARLNSVIERNTPNLSSKYTEYKTVAQSNIDKANGAIKAQQSKIADLQAKKAELEAQK